LVNAFQRANRLQGAHDVTVGAVHDSVHLHSAIVRAWDRSAAVDVTGRLYAVRWRRSQAYYRAGATRAIVSQAYARFIVMSLTIAILHMLIISNLSGAMPIVKHHASQTRKNDSRSLGHQSGLALALTRRGVEFTSHDDRRDE
jgi:hypothetical protein